ncbi:carbonic anhydrase [bacterium]|nr:carbonic anhydrase [bacterium]MBU1636261.1 carbonic anhydrase [bacterium]MBU1920257.1 carbonic anhydrase [bacterium]
MKADDALARLKEGNKRFIAAERSSLSVDAQLRDQLSKEQKPFACIVTCSDSRVPPELIFDCTAGELFVVRVAGTVQTPEVIGSVEFAVSILKVNLVVVMAHSRCGAIQAAVSREPVPERVAAIIDRLAPMVTAQQALGFEGEKLIIQVSKQNTRELSDALCRSQVISECLEKGLQVHRAYYKLTTGQLLWDFE